MCGRKLVDKFHNKHSYPTDTFSVCGGKYKQKITSSNSNLEFGNSVLAIENN